MIIRVIDFETTGTDETDEIVEIGWCDVDPDAKRVSSPMSCLTRPIEASLTPEVMAIHHITPEDIADCVEPQALLAAEFCDADVYCAHNSKFERQFFNIDKPWICTLKAARRIWPDAPRHTNMVLRYWLDLDLNRSLAEPAHRAGPDAYVTAWLLREILEHASVEDLIQWEQEPSLLPRIPFGKHRGEKWPDVPVDYLHWASRQDFNEDVLFTISKTLEAA